MNPSWIGHVSPFRAVPVPSDVHEEIHDLHRPQRHAHDLPFVQSTVRLYPTTTMAVQ